MGLGHSPRIVTDGLVLCLDAGNAKSYPGILSSELVTDASLTQIDGVTVNVIRDAIQNIGVTLCNVEAGKTYYVDYLISSYTGTTGATFRLNGGAGNLTPTIGISAAGRFNRKFTASVSGSLGILGDNTGTNFNIDYVSIREVLTGTGLTMFDLSGNAYNGTLTNGPVYGTVNGGTVVFDGIDDGILISSTALLSLNNMTISSWNKSASYNQNGFLFEKTTNGNVNTQYSLFFNNNSTLYYRTIGLSVQDLTYGWAGQNTIINNSWHNIVATFDGIYKKIYINGILRATSAALTGTVVQNTTGAAYVGVYGNFGGYRFNGSISDTKIYNRALTDEEIFQNFNALRGRYGI